MAFIDSESVAVAILWRLSTPTVGVNSLSQKFIIMNDADINTYHLKCYAANSAAKFWGPFTTTQVVLEGRLVVTQVE